MLANTHDQLFAQINEEKPPVIVLLIEIKKATDLSIKDANGFSDPYCMLGIVPGDSGRISELKNFDSDSLESNQKDISKQNSIKKVGINRYSSKAEIGHKSSFIKRFSSFRRSENKTHVLPLTQISAKSNNVQLPAKYIKATTVKKATLNPEWNEKFRLLVMKI